MQSSTLGPQQALVGGVLYQSVTKAVNGFRQLVDLTQQPGCAQVPDRCLQLITLFHYGLEGGERELRAEDRSGHHDVMEARGQAVYTRTDEAVQDLRDVSAIVATEPPSCAGSD